MLTPPSPQGVRKINLQVAACVKPLFKLLLMNATTKAVMIPPFIFLLRFFFLFSKLSSVSKPIQSNWVAKWISITRPFHFNWALRRTQSVFCSKKGLGIWQIWQIVSIFPFMYSSVPKILDFESWTVFFRTLKKWTKCVLKNTSLLSFPFSSFQIHTSCGDWCSWFGGCVFIGFSRFCRNPEIRISTVCNKKLILNEINVNLFNAEVLSWKRGFLEECLEWSGLICWNWCLAISPVTFKQ